MNLQEATTKLRALGITIPVEIVREAVQRLRNGESIYKLHSLRSGNVHLVARATARKIKKLLDEGKLGFLFEVQPELEAITSATRVAAEGPTRPMPPYDLATPDGFEARRKALLNDLPDVDWDIESLERIGIPLEEALDLLIEHDDIEARQAYWTRYNMLRFLELHLLVSFCGEQAKKTNRAPYEFIEVAAFTGAKGEIDYNPFLVLLSKNILKYQVWRGHRFLESFQQAQFANNRAAKRTANQINNLLEELARKSSQAGEETDG